MISVSELAVYPVKSFAQLSVDQWIVDSFGFAGDRRWMVIRPDGSFVTARSHSRMVLVQATPSQKGLLLSAAGRESICVSIPVPGETVIVTVWKDDCEALDAGDSVALWLSDFLGEACRLVYMPDSSFRQVDARYAPKGVRTGFADGFPFLLISEGSLDLLNSKLVDPVPMKRFRPNIVVSGCEPHAEDNWKRIRISGIEFSLVKSCTRCVFTTVNTDTGERGKEPLRTLAGYRREESGITFGQNLVHHGAGYLSVGGIVEIIE